MDVRRAWLLVVLPAVGALLGMVGYVLLTVGESDRVGLPTLLGAACGLLGALPLVLRRARPRADRPSSASPSDRPR